jgi:CRP/FNR family transcriptional regulator, cyclic AMP receptor protein
MNSKPRSNKEPPLSPKQPSTKLTQDERVFLLSRVPIFSALSTNTIDLLLQDSPVVEVKAGKLFFNENETGSGMFLLEKGRVCIFRQRDNKEYILAELGEGDCFGEMEMLDLMPRSATVRAISDYTAVHISYTAFHKLFKQNPQEFGLLMMNLARELSRRLMSSNGRVMPPEKPGGPVS